MELCCKISIINHFTRVEENPLMWTISTEINHKFKYVHTDIYRYHSSGIHGPISLERVGLR